MGQFMMCNITNIKMKYWININVILLTIMHNDYIMISILITYDGLNSCMLNNM